MKSPCSRQASIIIKRCFHLRNISLCWRKRRKRKDRAREAREMIQSVMNSLMMMNDISFVCVCAFNVYMN